MPQMIPETEKKLVNICYDNHFFIEKGSIKKLNDRSIVIQETGGLELRVPSMTIFKRSIGSTLAF